MNNKTKELLEQIRNNLKLEDFQNNNTHSEDALANWRNWRDVLASLKYASYERAFALVDRARDWLDNLNNEQLAKISPLLDTIEQQARKERKQELKQINKTLIFVNVKAIDVPHDIKRALLNNKALFTSCGMVANKPLFIKRLQDHKPMYLKQFDENMKRTTNCARWFYIIELDEESAKERRLWSSHKNILCDITNGVAQELEAEQFIVNNNYYSRRRADVYGLDSFWRKSDYESARKCAKNIYCVYQVGNELDKAKEKQKARKEEKQLLTSLDYYRHDTSNATFDAEKHLFREDKRGCYYYTTNRFDLFDVCGWNISNKRDALKEKARQLKAKRDKEHLIETGCAEEIEKTRNLICDMVASLDQLTAMLKRYLINNKKIRLFWLQSRIERTTDKIASLCELRQALEQKNEVFDNISAMLERYEKRTTEARHTLQLNDIYLSMSEQEHADTESAKNNAIYFGYYNEVDGALVLDIERAQKKLNERGY